MIRNKFNNDKRSNSESDNENDLMNDDEPNDMVQHQAKQQKHENIGKCSSQTTSSAGISVSPITTETFQNTNTSILSCATDHNDNKKPLFYFNNNETITYDNRCQDDQTEKDKKFFNLSSPNLSSSLKNAFQMSNINMASLHNYIPQLPSVSMPSMPNIPLLTMPSLPNISMPSIPNINILSISDFMCKYRCNLSLFFFN